MILGKNHAHPRPPSQQVSTIARHRVQVSLALISISLPPQTGQAIRHGSSSIAGARDAVRGGSGRGGVLDMARSPVSVILNDCILYS